MLWIESTRSSASNDEVLERHAATIQRNLHRFRPIAEFRNVSHDDAARDEDELLGLLEGDGVLIHSRRLAAILGAACSLSPDDPGIQQHPIISRRFLAMFLKLPAGTIHPFHSYLHQEA